MPNAKKDYQTKEKVVLQKQPIVDALAERIKNAEVGILVVTHDLQLALDCAGYAMLLHEGRIAAAGDPADILTPETLSPVYGCPFRRFDCAGRPVILPE